MRTFIRICKMLLLLSPPLFLSCQKEITDESAQDDGVRIKRLIMLDTAQANPLDTIRYAGFQYDSGNRLAYLYLCSLNSTGGLDTSIKTWFFYDGLSAVPNKYILQELDPGGVILARDTVYLGINPDGFAMYDSSCLSSGSSRVIISGRYAFSGSRLVATQRNYGNDPLSVPSVVATVYHQQRTGDNLLYQLDTSGDFREEYNNSFDANPNPLFRAVPLRYPDFRPDNFIFDNSNKNNISGTHFTETNVPTSTITATVRLQFAYEYNTAGYPLIARQFDQQGGSPGHIKYVYEYY